MFGTRFLSSFINDDYQCYLQWLEGNYSLFCCASTKKV